MTVPGSLLARLIEQRVEIGDLEYPWDLRAFVKLSAALTEQLDHSFLLSLTINGAPLLYNLMLAEKSARPDKDELREGFEARLVGWAREVQVSASAVEGWDRSAFWDVVAKAGTRTPPPTRHFIDRWLDLVIDGDPSGLADNKAARKLISERERVVKRGRARLHNPQALALWGGDAGTARMVYRWPYVQRIVVDILAGLGGTDA
jgi:hypothetical protein